MADQHAKSQPPILVVEQQETPSAKNEKEPLKGQLSIAPSVVSGKLVKSYHASVHKSEHRSEAIELTTLQIEKKLQRGVIIPSSQPIPADVKSVNSSDSALDQEKKPTKAEGKEIDEIGGEKQKHGKIKEKDLEWSDDEEASGLPRSESRASRVSRAVQKMFCCGVTYEAPSEEDDLNLQCASPEVIVDEETSTARWELNDIDAKLQEVKKKEVSWHKQRVQENEKYQAIDLQSNSLTLVRKASFGPCRHFSATGRPSGISINIPRKSSKSIDNPSGINVTISKKSLASVSAKLEEQNNEPQNSEVKIEGERKSVFFNFLKSLPAIFRKKS